MDFQECYIDISANSDLLQEMSESQRLWEVDKLSHDIYVKEIKRAYKKRFGRKEFLDWETEQELIVRASKGDSVAIENLIIANLGLVIYEARKFQNRGLPLNDLISEGNFGLFQAAKKCENRGFRFQTYAKYHIRSSIRQAIMQYGTTIHYPLNILSEFRKIQKFILSYYLKSGDMPSDEFVADSLKMEVDRVANLRYIVKAEISLDALSDYVNNLDLFEALFLGVYTTEADEGFRDESLQITILEALSQLSEREQKILKMFFGITCKEMDLVEIGIKFNLTKERTRQIKEKAIRKLKGQRSVLLKMYLG